MFRLIMIRGPKPGKIYELTDSNLTIGRGRKNHIIIHDNEVSREHCRFILSEASDYYNVFELKSSNGTFVNGQRVDSEGWPLQGKSIVELGDTITFQYIPSGATDDLDNHLHHDDEVDLEPYLIVKISSQTEPQVYPLEDMVIGIGRDVDNDIVIQEPEMSRHHLRFVMSPSGYMIEDLGSLNGTRVNGLRLNPNEPRTMRVNDIIHIGTMVKMSYTTDPETIADQFRSESSTRLPRVDTPTHTTTAGMTRALSDDITASAPPGPTHRLKIMEDTPEGTEVGHGLDKGELEGNILLVYSRSDWTDVVAPLYTFLDDNGVPVWVDQYLTPNSEDWQLALEQARSECAALVVVVSPASLALPQVTRSVPRFRNRARPVFLLMYERVKRLPISLKDLPQIDYNVLDPETSYRKVLQAARKALE